MKEPGQEERAVIGRAKGGDSGAFEKLVVRYQEVTFRAAYAVLRDAGQAEDAAQEAFIRAHAALPRFNEARPFKPWILRIAINQALTMLKRRRGHPEAPLQDQGRSLAYGIDETVISRERAAQLSHALEQIGEKERTIIYLRYFLNLNEREVAEYLGCPAGTAKSRLHRALGKLGKAIRKLYPQLLEEQG